MFLIFLHSQKTFNRHTPYPFPVDILMFPINTSPYFPSSHWSTSHNRWLRSPNILDYRGFPSGSRYSNGHIASVSSRISHLSSTYSQPRPLPPTVSSHYHFVSWDPNHCPRPLRIHRQTPISMLHEVISFVEHVRFFTVGVSTYSNSAPSTDTSSPTLQVQGIHHKYFSRLISIDLHNCRDAPLPFSELIGRLYRTIFSSTNYFITWGSLSSLLSPFQTFLPFDLTLIDKTLDLQQFFTRQWNRQHPHTDVCLARHQPVEQEILSDDCLICYVEVDDLENDFDRANPLEDYTSCICPTSNRPYKYKNALWTLEKAMSSTFPTASTALLGDQPMSLSTFTNYSHHSRSDVDLILFHDLLACTELYFYLTQLHVPKPSSIFTNSTPITLDPIISLPILFILADSHGKCFSPFLLTDQYKIITRCISGLHWRNIHDYKLCTEKVLASAPISALLSSARAILLLVGSNSVRHVAATAIIKQVEETLHFIRSSHSHLRRKQTITLTKVFPCGKLSPTFSYYESLSANINTYNSALEDLSGRLNISILDAHISHEHLSPDQLHLANEHQHILRDSIVNYTSRIRINTSTLPQSTRRSRVAISRRNRVRHLTNHRKHFPFTITRSVHASWKLADVKAFLRQHAVPFCRILGIRKNLLRIQFTNDEKRLQGDAFLSENCFDAQAYVQS